MQTLISQEKNSNNSKQFFTGNRGLNMSPKEYAQFIAFAPLVFQATRILRDSGLLKIVYASHESGITIEEAANKSSVSIYGVRVLFEAALGIGILKVDSDRYKITKTGFYVLHDKMTNVNMDFVHDVCYKGMFDLDRSIETGKPVGLKTFGSWNTVYEALSFLPEQVQKSWFEFDHFYSDTSFSEVISHVFRNNPKKILDIGGNTGKWAIACTSYSKTVQVKIVDLPGQLKMAQEIINKEEFSKRISFHELNILDMDAKLPDKHDAIWMSQFLDCFSENEIISILQKCHDVLEKNGEVFILEPFWNRQQYQTSAFCLQMISLYFTNIANGNSKMYSSSHFIDLIAKAGFSIIEEIDNIGICHSLLRCRKMN